MKNSVKFFLGGIAVATLVFVALAFTNAKQDGNKEYLVVRVKEDVNDNKIYIQVCDKSGKIEAYQEKLEKTKDGIFRSLDAGYTIKFASIINKYSQGGYTLISSNSETPVSANDALYTTLIFEK